MAELAPGTSVGGFSNGERNLRCALREDHGTGANKIGFRVAPSAVEK
jgi:hypothetical protein